MTVAERRLVCEAHTVNVPASVRLTDGRVTSGEEARCHSVQASLSFLKMGKVTGLKPNGCFLQTHASGNKVTIKQHGVLSVAMQSLNSVVQISYCLCFSLAQV